MKIRWILFEFFVLLLGSAIVGCLVGTVLHYVGFGLRGGGLGIDWLEFALFEGGIVGVAFAVPTGLFAYYIVLRRRVTPKQVVIIILGSLGGGLAITSVAPIFAALFTPLITLGIALRFRLHQPSETDA
jgi:hypothetical protein